MSRRAPCLWLTLLILVSAVVVPTLAQDEAEEYARPELVMRVYDVSDQMVVVPEFGTSVPRMGISDVLTRDPAGPDGGFFDADDEVTVAGAERLRALIERSVRPEEPWESMGGGSTLDFVEAEGKIVVCTTEQGHKDLAGLLSELGPGPACLMIDVQVVELKADFVNDCYATGRFVFRGADGIRSLQQATAQHLGRASLCALEGQRVWHQASGHRAYVRDVEPVVAENAVAYDKTVGHLVSGLVGDVRATTSTDKTSAVVEYRLQYSVCKDVEDGDGNSPALPTTTLDCLKGTVRVPMGGAVLLAAGRDTPERTEGASAEKHFILAVYTLGN